MIFIITVDAGCEQCSKILVIPPPPLHTISSQPTVQPNPTVQPKPTVQPTVQPKKPSASPTPSKNGAPTDKPRRRTTFLKKVKSVFTASPDKAKQVKAQTSTTHLQTPTPSPLSRLPSSTNTNPGVEPGEWSVAYNDRVETAFGVEDAHLFFHAATIECVKFSPNGRHLAAACSDGKAYIYDVESGGLTW